MTYGVGSRVALADAEDGKADGNAFPCEVDSRAESEPLGAGANEVPRGVAPREGAAATVDIQLCVAEGAQNDAHAHPPTTTPVQMSCNAWTLGPTTT